MRHWFAKKEICLMYSVSIFSRTELLYVREERLCFYEGGMLWTVPSFLNCQYNYDFLGELTI